MMTLRGPRFSGTRPFGGYPGGSFFSDLMDVRFEMIQGLKPGAFTAVDRAEAVLCGSAQPFEFRNVFLFALFHEAEAFAYNFAGVAEASGRNAVLDEAIEVVGQVDVAGWHDSDPSSSRLALLAIIANRGPGPKSGIDGFEAFESGRLTTVASWRRVVRLIRAVIHWIHEAGMIKRLTKHGNSLALIIDRPILELLKIDPETPLDVSTDGKRLIVAPAKLSARKSFEAAQELVHKRYGKAFQKLAG